MRPGDLAFVLAAVVLLQIAVNANSNGNNTMEQQPDINKIHTTGLSIKINSTKENSTNLLKESQIRTNKTNKSLNAELGQLTETPLKRNDEPRIEEGQNGKLNSDSYIEECDPSNRCEDEKKRFTACLRVPGTDSLALSLLIENRGSEPLNIDISAPNFVNLEQFKVELKSKEHKEVKVSLYKDSNNSKILLKSSQESRCILTLPNTITIEPSRSFHARFLLTFIASLIILTLIISTYLCVKCKRSQTKSEKLEELLPVSTGVKVEFREKAPESWENYEKVPEKWESNWGDEEAPLTPSKPFLKPLSKGLNSRKFNKDLWKD
ncbi:hypothetical protein LUZ60_000573 [Juncus effusus]|nr:hypothetical protein LUZ60_000573 [Juncus effusus]